MSAKVKRYLLQTGQLRLFSFCVVYAHTYQIYTDAKHTIERCYLSLSVIQIIIQKIKLFDR